MPEGAGVDDLEGLREDVRPLRDAPPDDDAGDRPDGEQAGPLRRHRTSRTSDTDPHTAERITSGSAFVVSSSNR